MVTDIKRLILPSSSRARNQFGLLDPEDKGTTKIQNSSNHLPVNTAHHFRKPEPSCPVTDAL
jgi:hypothetical protein